MPLAAISPTRVQADGVGNSAEETVRSANDRAGANGRFSGLAGDLRTAGRQPLLSAEEERRLARAVEAADRNAREPDLADIP